MTTTERSATADDDTSPERTDTASSSSFSYLVLGIVVVLLFGPVYLLVVVAYNAVRLVVHVFRVVRTRARLWARIVGTATVQRRLDGDILAARADVRRFARELYQLRDEDKERPLTEADIDHLDTLINYRERVTAESFRVGFPFGAALKLLASGNAEPSLRHAKEALFPEEEAESETPEIPANAMWARTAMEMLNQADELLKSNTEAAYRAFLRADRYLVLGEYLLYVEEIERRPEKSLTDPLQSHARLVWDAASAYEGRRVNVVRELLFGDDDSKIKPTLSLIELDKAMFLLNTYRLEDYRRFETLRVNILTFVGIASLLVAGALVFFPTMEALGPVGIPERRLFQLVLAFGALGAAISGVRSIEHDSESLQSLEEILGYWLSVVRMFVGALSAFIVAIFLFSGVVAPEFLSLPLVLGVSLAAGFSERLLLRAISSFEGQASGTAPVPERRRPTRDEE